MSDYNNYENRKPKLLCIGVHDLSNEMCVPAYPSNSNSMWSSSKPPTTLNFRKLHTCVFSYFPNFICFTIAGRCSLSVRNCGGVFVFDDHLDTWLLGQSSRMFLFASKQIAAPTNKQTTTEEHTHTKKQRREKKCIEISHLNSGIKMRLNRHNINNKQNVRRMLKIQMLKIGVIECAYYLVGSRHII